MNVKTAVAALKAALLRKTTLALGLYRYVLLGCIAVCLSIVGCSPSYEEPVPKIEGEFLVHVVHGNGETVKQLTKWYTGSEENVPAIRRANKGISSGELKNGRRVFIPLALVVNTEPPLLVLPTPTPSKLVVIPEQPQAMEENVNGSSESAPQDVSDLERFEEEVGPADSKLAAQDSDVMVIKGAPTVPAVAASQGAPPLIPIAPQTIPTAMPQGGTKTVEEFESQVDKLLLKEQAELDQLQRELAAGGVKRATPANTPAATKRR